MVNNSFPFVRNDLWSCPSCMNVDDSLFPTSYSNAVQQTTSMSHQQFGKQVSSSTAQKKYNLLDLGHPILEKIVSYVLQNEDSNPRLHKDTLSIASSCTVLRQVIANLLTNDALWILHSSNFFYDGMLDTCSSLSNDVFETLHQPSIQTILKCKRKPCSVVHEQLVWYKLAGSNLRTLHLSSLLRYITLREIVDILQSLTRLTVPLRNLNLFCPHDVRVSKQADIFPALKQLVTSIASTLTQLSFYTGYSILVYAICSQPLPCLKELSLKFHSDLPHPDRQASDIGISCQLLKHCFESGATLETLSVYCHAKRLEHLHNLSVYPNVVKLSLHPAEKGFKMGFPLPMNMINFKIQQLHIHKALIGDIEMERIVCFVACTESLSEFHLHTCRTWWLSKALELYPSAFGKKLITLDFFHDHIRNPVWDAELLGMISTHCINLQCLRLRVLHEDTLGSVGMALENLNKLKILHLDSHSIIKLGKQGIKDFMLGARKSTSPIEQISLKNISVEREDVCELLDHFSDTIEQLKVGFLSYYMGSISRSFRKYSDVHYVLTHTLQHWYQYDRLKILKLPAYKLLQTEKDEDEKKIVQEIDLLKSKLSMQSLEL